MKDAAYKQYLLVVLAAILASNYVDRLILGMVLERLKTDLVLSDTQLGLLGGMAFAVFYAVMGIPIARWADRGNRVRIISLTVFLWSAATALCGAAQSFLQLLLIRIGVAVGEAGCIPPAHSLIADYFDRAERPRAVALYMLGVPLSSVLGYFLAGWLNEIYGWRATFTMVGLPGLGLAALAWFTLREPRSGKAVTANRVIGTSLPQSLIGTATSKELSLRDVLAALWANATFRNLGLCFAVVCFFSYGIHQWQAAFFIRSYGLKTGELGTWFALIYGIGGFLGTIWGGELASRRAASNERLQLKAIAAVYCAFGVVSCFIYLSTNAYLAFGLIAITNVGTAMANGPLFATVQTIVPERMRATSLATMYLFSNLIGLGLGPLTAGALSDALRPLLGEQSLRYSLLGLCPGFIWAGWHVWRASQSVNDDLDAIRLPHESVEIMARTGAGL